MIDTTGDLFEKLVMLKKDKPDEYAEYIKIVEEVTFDLIGLQKKCVERFG